jgi:TatA/E family protein of Tat protein translocase
MLPLPSGFEWIVILVIALLILGPGKLPDVASAVGKSIREFRKATTEVADAVKVETSPLPATPAPPGPQATPAANVLEASAQPNVLQPVAPVAPATSEVPPPVAAPEAPQPVADAVPTDAAPRADG